MNWDGTLNAALESIDLHGSLAWVEKYCRDKPLDPFVHAASALAVEIINRELRRSPKQK